MQSDSRLRSKGFLACGFLASATESYGQHTAGRGIGQMAGAIAEFKQLIRHFTPESSAPKFPSIAVENIPGRLYSKAIEVLSKGATAQYNTADIAAMAEVVVKYGKLIVDLRDRGLAVSATDTWVDEAFPDGMPEVFVADGMVMVGTNLPKPLEGKDLEENRADHERARALHKKAVDDHLRDAEHSSESSPTKLTGPKGSNVPVKPPKKPKK